MAITKSDLYDAYDKMSSEAENKLSTGEAICEGFKVAAGSIIASGLGYAATIASIPAVQRVAVDLLVRFNRDVCGYTPEAFALEMARPTPYP